MIFPPSARSRTGARCDLVDAAPVGIHNGASRSVRAQIHGVRDSITVFVGLTGERKRGVERALVGDVGPDAQPVRSKSVIPYPGLQVERERRAGSDDRLG